MRTALAFGVAIALWTGVGDGAAAASPAWYGRGDARFTKRVEIRVTNSLALRRAEEPLTIRLSAIKEYAQGFDGSGFVVVDGDALPDSPCHVEANGNDVPCQVDDTDGDGSPDELVFLATLAPGETRTYHLYYSPSSGLGPPVYPKRTQITAFESDPNALFAIESDVLMFRFGRGDSPGLGLAGDVFGKYQERPAYLQHLYQRVIHGLDTDTPAGRWLLYPLNSLERSGIGSVVALKGENVFRPDGDAKVSGRIISDGRLLSRGEIRISNWKVDEAVLDVHVVVTMYAGQHFASYEVEASAQGNADGLRLGVGMMALESERRAGGLEQGYSAAWGTHDAGLTQASKTSWFGYGYPEAAGWGRSVGMLDVGLALLYRPGDMSELRETESGSIVLLRGDLRPDRPLRAQMQLSAGWKRGGYFDGADDFFTYQEMLSRTLQAPVRVEVAGVEERPAPAPRKALQEETFFLSNPSCVANALPAEIDLDAFGLKAAGGVVCTDEGVVTDTAELAGRTKVFLQASVPALTTTALTLKGGTVASAPSFTIREYDEDRDGRKDVRVEAGGADWLVTADGLAAVNWRGKELALHQRGVAGEARLVHNGPVVAVVRVGAGESAVEYCFFRSLPAVKISSGRAMDLRGEGCSSYVAKKEMRVEGAEKLQICHWGRMTSDRIAQFKKTDVCYPAEWAALYSAQEQVALMAYGNPSTGPMIVDRGGVLHVDGPAAGERRELTLCLIERPEDGEETFPRLCAPLVSVAHEGGFLSMAYRDGNGVPDAVFVEDRNGNATPDFAGDRWHFDLNGDDALESILEFEPSEARPDRAVRMKVYCDTATGQSELHSNQFLGRYCADRPYADVPTHGQQLVTMGACFYDGCLGAGETGAPFFVYEDWNGDGLFFKGPVTEGGFISGDLVTARYGGPSWWGGSFLLKDWLLECWDLDGDEDNDAWWIKMLNAPAGLFEVKEGENFLHWGYFDISDVNLEPAALVDAFGGRAGWSVRYGSFVDSDNGKLYQLGFETDGRYVGHFDWPFPSGWDIDNDGVAEGTVYDNLSKWMFTFDLLNRINRDDPYVGEKLYLERDLLYQHPTRHENFCLGLRIGPRPGDPARNHEYLISRFPFVTLEDPAGHVMRFGGHGVPDGWRGGELRCRQWPNGLYDYTPSNGWQDCLKASRYMSCHHWLRPLWRTAHEANWGMLYIREDARVEINPEGQDSDQYSLYFSPVVNGYHLKGLQFGVQTMRADDEQAAKGRYRGPYWDSSGPKGPQAVREYADAERLLNDYSRLARKNGTLFLYYTDDDGDGYVDTYVLDNDHDGTYEKRVWYDHNSGTLAVHDQGQVAVAPIRLEMPEYRLELKNYERIVEQYRATEDKEALLWKWTVQDGRLEGHDGLAFVLSREWLPTVAVDLSHRADGANPWNDYEPGGLDTLARVLSQLRAEPAVLSEAWSAQSLSGVDVLTAWNLETAPSEAELAALDAFLESGGILLLMTAPEAPPASADVMIELARRFGVAVSRDSVLSVSYRDWEEAYVPGAFSLKVDRPIVIDGELDEWSGPKGIELTMKWDASPSRPGPYDVKSDVYLRWDERNFYLGAEVWDKNQFNEQTGESIWEGDCIQFALGKGVKYQEYGIALTSRGPEVYRWIPQAGPVAGANLAVRRKDDRTVYELALPWDEVGAINAVDGTQLDFSLLLWDRASDREVESAAWGGGIKDGKDPSLFRRLTLTQSKEKSAQGVTAGAARAENFAKTATDHADGQLLREVAPFFFEARGLERADGGKVLLDWRGTPLISETNMGEGRVLVVASNVFDNKYMSPEIDLRVNPFKPGNQDLSANLMRYVLAPKRLEVSRIESGPQWAVMDLTGKGGKVALRVLWKEVTLKVDGTETRTERKEDVVSFEVPAGTHHIEVSGS